MEKFKKILPNLIFNIAETMVIALMGTLLNIEIKLIVMILLTFMITRGCLGKALHFKAWYKCLIWSSFVMLSLFILLKVDLTLSILFAIFNALIMTGKTNVCDMYFWNNKGEPSKYQDVVEFVKYNEFNDKLLEFEKKLKDKSDLEFIIYKYRFKENRTFADISERLDNLENSRIVEHLDKIALALRIYCGI